MSPGGLRGLQNRCEAWRTSWVCSIRTHLRQFYIMEYKTFLVIGFYSSFKSFEAEDLAQRTGIPVRLIPRPKEVGGELRCGNALRFKPEDKFSLLKLLDKQNIEYTEPVEILDF